MSDGNKREPPEARRWIVRTLIAVPVVMLGVLAWRPDTAWLVRAQCRLLYSSQNTYIALREWRQETVSSPDPEWFRNRLEQVARQHPDDYLIQLAWTLEESHPSEVNLRDLLPRFANRPALLAHILRYDTMRRVRIRRMEEWMLYPPGERPNPQSLTPPHPQDLAAYDQVASEGERLDPDNAYFPLMRAVGLFAARRDTEAIEAIKRASRKPRWNDYTSEEAEAHLHLLTTAFGRQPAISQFLNARAVIEPHWAGIRSLTRMARTFAFEKEKRGEQREAASLRLAMLRCASLIRAQASTDVGVLVALAVGTVAISPAAQAHSQEPPEQRARRAVQQFVATLRRQGKDADASWAQSEFSAMEEARAIIRAGTQPERWLRMPLALVRAWMVNMLLLFSLSGVMALWLVYALIARTGLRQGITSYIVLPVTLLIVGVLFSLSSWADFPAQTLSALAYMVEAEGSQPTFVIMPPPLFRTAAAFAVVFLLLMLVTAIGVVGLIRGREPSVALVDGIRRGGLPIMAVLLVLYVFSVLHTASLEAAWQHDLQALREHAGKYYARQLGKTWR
ncbi:MAG: hypothetical protein NZ749_11235 [bacterium]|nr:hypothetical protein [bacterium]